MSKPEHYIVVVDGVDGKFDARCSACGRMLERKENPTLFPDRAPIIHFKACLCWDEEDTAKVYSAYVPITPAFEEKP